MATYNPMGSRISLICQVGTGADGQPELGRLSISRVNPNLTADQIDSLSQKLGGLLSVPVVEVRKTDTDTVVA
ncbi:MAG: DUF1659 domain-containing protein [Dethiosulfovibrio peptidovorans]|nr:MAG: DUF1659 domain-containing protein [Dethiosulfovibrio peptidovorans]